MKLAQVRILESCSASWHSMPGDRSARHCVQCNRDVHDLSSMSRTDAEALLSNPGRPPCVRFVADGAGTPLTRDDLPFWVRWTRRSRWLVAACAAMGFTMNLVGCMGVAVAQPDRNPRPLTAGNDA